jgi:ElaB/YqjD/DUF883 family membrane-anchored ribosome-binding protein
MTTQNSTFPDPTASEAASPELRVRMRNALETGKTRLTEWKGGFEEGVRARPIQSILIATAVGAAIGLLLGRRSR